MRIRQLITGLTIAAGLCAAFGGFLYAWNTEDMFVGSVWMILGVGCMAGSVIYSLALDDAESRTTALTTNRHTSIDLRDPIESPVREDVSARVSV